MADMEKFFIIPEDYGSEALAESRRKREFDRLYPESGVKYRYSAAFLSSFSADTAEQKKLKSLVEKFLREFLESETHRGMEWLVLLGRRGTGKTYAACTICNELSSMGHAAQYIALPRLLSEIKQGYGKGENRLNDFINVPFLALDELGVIRLSEDDYRNLLILLDERYAEELPTVLISNSPGLDFLGEALIDRLSEIAKIITLEGESRRRKQ